MWQRTVDCLGLAVSVRTNALDIAPVLEGVLRTYADSQARVEIAYELDAAGPRVLRDGALLHGVELPIDLVPAFERDLYRRVLALVPALTLHAGAVVDARGIAIVVAGRSGAGKSTLVRALLQRGFAYLSEECVSLRPGRRCLGLARALHVDDPALVLPAGYACDDYPLRPHPPGTFRLFHPPEAAIWRGEARTGAIVAIDHAPDSPDTRTLLGGGAALAALWPAMFRHTPEVLADVGPALEGVPVHQLHTPTAARALDQVVRLAEELGRERA